MKIAIVIPVYNEERTLCACIERLRASHAGMGGGVAWDMIAVDDGSTDRSAAILAELAAVRAVHTIRHEINRGKGAAIRTGLTAALARGADIALIHDADLEYDPADHASVLAPILDGRADAVIGSRFIGHTHRVLYYWHSVANRIITTLSNMATNLNLTDVECCTKALTRRVLERLNLTEERFGIEIELIAKVARMRLPDGSGERHARVYEVPVSYAGRTYEEGKKITWRDGAAAVWCIGKYGVFSA
ncbi:MAG: glycosyltransferase family 2 protein [Phycisphaerae bacterium]|nr:glycosyltransferase family 2 protein [Phycisphaerae bacterium]